MEISLFSYPKCFQKNYLKLHTRKLHFMISQEHAFHFLILTKGVFIDFRVRERGRREG